MIPLVGQRTDFRQRLRASFETVLLLIVLAVFPAQSSAAESWHEFRSEHGFTVEFPGVPEVTAIASDQGSLDVEHAVDLDSGSFLVAVSELSSGWREAGGIPAVIGAIRDAHRAERTIREDHPSRAGGVPIHEFVWEQPDGIIGWQRIYIRGDRLYQLIFVSDVPPRASRAANRFFDSFSFTD